MRKRTSTEQSYEPLVTPESWKGDELRFSVRLTQILDGLFARLRAMRAELAGKLGKTEQAADSAKLGGVSAGSFALKTDTAPNAEKLGGKMPEYYLTPVNLLCNGDFLNPIHSRGVTANTTHWEYVLDCWHCESANYTPNTVLISNGGVTLAPTADAYCGIQQQFERYSELAGKICTAAVCTNETWYVATFPVGFTSGSGILLGNGLLLYSLSTHHFLIRNKAGNSAVTIQRVALYEGSYTAETLPPYVPSHKRVEILKIGLPIQPVNLLDNSWFGGRYVDGVKEGLVCQAGLNGFHGTTKYPMDRWISWNLDAGFADGYITVNSPYDQRLDPNKIDANKVYTVAACFADGTITCSSGVASANIGGYANIGLYFNYNNGAPYVRMWHNAADNYKWVALYEGKYTAETLPPYVPKPYTVELEGCRRCYRPQTQFILRCYGDGYLFGYTFDSPMRIAPTFTIDGVYTGVWEAVNGETTIGDIFASDFGYVQNPNFKAGEYYRVIATPSADL